VTIERLIDIALDLMKCRKPIVQEDVRFRPIDSEVRVLTADSSKLRKETGWAPKVPLEQGLLATINWWRERLCGGSVRSEHSFMT
jgi:nucleoside-diphosphate-sugar epimerase